MTLEIHLNGYHVYRPSAWISVEGEDAHEFLQSQFSNDLDDLEVGGVCYGLWLDQKGKIHGDSHILRTGEETFFLFSYHTAAKALIEKLSSYIVADDVDLEDLTDQVTGVAIPGNASEALDSLGNLSKAETVLYRFAGRRGRQASVELVVQENQLDRLLETLQLEVSMETLDETSMEAMRVFSRIPKIPYDLGSGELPQEAGLETEAVSFTKGCYLGQEVMSRLHSMGRVRRSLQLVESSKLIDYGSELFAEGKKVGIVKTSIEYQNGFFSLALLSNTVSNASSITVGKMDGLESVKILD